MLWGASIFLATSANLFGGDPVAVVRRRGKPNDLLVQKLGDRQVTHPGRLRQDHRPLEQREDLVDRLLRPGHDDNTVRIDVEIEMIPPEFGNLPSERLDPDRRQIFSCAAMLPQRFLHAVRDGKGGAPEREMGVIVSASHLGALQAEHGDFHGQGDILRHLNLVDILVCQ